jgi:alpha-glucosidase
VAALLLLTLRGTPTLYYGDELGMHDVPIPADRIQDPLEKNVPGKGLGRDPSRTPMQWDVSPHAGFGAHEPWLPIAADFAQVNVAVENDDPGSILSLYRQLLRLRRQRVALSVGGYQAIAARGAVLAYVRHSNDERLLIVANLGAEPAEFGLQSMGTRHTILLSTHWEGAPEIMDTILTLRPDEGVLIELDAPRLRAR